MRSRDKRSPRPVSPVKISLHPSPPEIVSTSAMIAAPPLSSVPEPHSRSSQKTPSEIPSPPPQPSPKVPSTCAPKPLSTGSNRERSEREWRESATGSETDLCEKEPYLQSQRIGLSFMMRPGKRRRDIGHTPSPPRTQKGRPDRRTIARNRR